ncbi:MAG TPA: 4-(cytidine 5'-diphospho)-2-C-methyl-D-erythritol kinase [Candidatus Dormibacteraeota bacterium]|nr:4-(cytidine 5'-diphospho)-2-C-methyl-D-erythritol kinase [Candidatus Dormibacteraeota bacterium]
MKLALPARAKLNLELEVVSRRDDGFHELRTTFQAVELHDLLQVEDAAEASLTSDGFHIKRGDENSVLRAQRTLEESAHRKLPARFHLHKRIPPGSGLGGASSDAAAVLRGLAAIYRLDVDLAAVAREVGADVPFFLLGGRARAEGRGEHLSPLEMDPAWFVIAWPGIELSTADVYRAWDEVKGEGPNHLRRAAEIVEPALEDFASRLGAGWQMTGSGSAFFIRCTGHDEANRKVAAIESLRCWTSITQAIGPWA